MPPRLCEQDCGRQMKARRPTAGTFRKLNNDAIIPETQSTQLCPALQRRIPSSAQHLCEGIWSWVFSVVASRPRAGLFLSGRNVRGRAVGQFCRAWGGFLSWRMRLLSVVMLDGWGGIGRRNRWSSGKGCWCVRRSIGQSH